MLRLLCTLCCLSFSKWTYSSPLQSTSSSVKTTEGGDVVVFDPAVVAFVAAVIAVAANVLVLDVAVRRDPPILIAAVARGVVVKLPVPILIAGDELIAPILTADDLAGSLFDILHCRWQTSMWCCLWVCYQSVFSYFGVRCCPSSLMWCPSIAV